MADSKIELVQVKAAFATELAGVQVDAPPETYSKLSQEWVSLDAELAQHPDEHALALTKIALQALQNAKTTSGDTLDDKLGTLHSGLTGIRELVQLAGNPTAGNPTIGRKRPGTTTSGS